MPTTPSPPPPPEHPLAPDLEAIRVVGDLPVHDAASERMAAVGMFEDISLRVARATLPWHVARELATLQAQGARLLSELARGTRTGEAFWEAFGAVVKQLDERLAAGLATERVAEAAIAELRELRGRIATARLGRRARHTLRDVLAMMDAEIGGLLDGTHEAAAVTASFGRAREVIEGTLALEAEGCLRAVMPPESAGHVVVWAEGLALDATRATGGEE